MEKQAIDSEDHNTSADRTKKRLLDIKTKRLFWTISILISLIFTGLLVWQLFREAHTSPVLTRIANQADLEAFLEEHWKTRADPDAIVLPIGIFIESLRFINDTDVHISGYVWQRRTDGVHDHLGEDIIFPEQVDSIVKPRLDYRVRIGDEVVVGWYFEGAFRHHYDYKDYPFDHKTVWLRLWSQNFNENLILVPDFQSYPCPDHPDQFCTGEGDTFGIAESIELYEFDRDDTYFDYQLSSYSTNFGFLDNIEEEHIPELRYNILLRRKSEDAFIIYIFPLMVVAVMAFTTLLITTRLEEKSSRFGYNVFSVISIVTALIFVVVLLQGHIREKLPGSGFVFLELFYFIAYFMLLFVAINAYLISQPDTSEWSLVCYEDNLIPKIIFFPLILGILLLFTILIL